MVIAELYEYDCWDEPDGRRFIRRGEFPTWEAMEAANEDFESFGPYHSQGDYRWVPLLIL
jgi:hypothetical protein